jgi:hypothetical protein
MKTYSVYKEYDPYGNLTQDRQEIYMSEKFFDMFYQMEDTVNRPLYQLIRRYHSMSPSDKFINTMLSKQDKLRFNYLDIRPADKGLISYMPGDKEQKMTDDCKWSRDGRQTMKIGRFIRQFFSPEILEYCQVTDQTLESFTSIVKGQMSGDDYTIEVVSGEEIRESYLEDNLLSDYRISGGQASSSTFGSCMRYEKCQPWLEMYVSEAKIKMLRMVHKESGKIAARALLWDGIMYHIDDDMNSPAQEIKFIDRIYAFREWMIEFMFDWASTNGYVKKAYQTHHNKTEVEFPDGTRGNGSMHYTLSQHYDYYPYLDTFSFLGDNKLHLFNWVGSPHYDHAWELCSYEDGNAEVNGMPTGKTECYSCDNNFDEDDMHDVCDHNICSGCRDEYYRYVEGEHHNCYYHVDNARYDAVDDCYIHEDDAVYAIGSRYNVNTHQDNAVEIKGQWYTKNHPGIVELHNGDDALLDDCTECEYDNKYYLSEETTFIDCMDVDVADRNLAHYMTDNDLVFNSDNEIVERGEDEADEDEDEDGEKVVRVVEKKVKAKKQLSEPTFNAGDYIVLLKSCDGLNYWRQSLPVDHVYRLKLDYTKLCFFPEVDTTGSRSNGWGGHVEYISKMAARIATPQEVQAYIDNGNKPCHIDKAKTLSEILSEIESSEQTPEQNIEEARRRYPVGSYFISALTGDTKRVLNPLYSQDRYGNTYADGNCVRNSAGVWAEIVSLTEPVLIPETLLEQALRMYPVGTTYENAHDVHAGYGSQSRHTVASTSFEVRSDEIIWGNPAMGCIYYYGTWAQIISVPETTTVRPQVLGLEGHVYDLPDIW